MTSKREAATAAALNHMNDASDELEALDITISLRVLAQRAWSLRARVVDFRGIRATFVVSGKAFALLCDQGVDIGTGGNAFERFNGEGASFGTLFGTPIIADAGDSRHGNISLILDGSDLDATPEQVDPSTVRGLDAP